MAFTPVDYIASYFGWNQFTPALPNFYWDVYSAEERVKKICFELDKLCNYANMLADNINIDHNLIDELQKALANIEQLDEIDEKVQELQATANDIEAILETLPSYEQFLSLERNVAQLNESMDDNVAQLTENKIPWPSGTNPKYGSNGQVLRTNGDGSTAWQNPVIPTDEQAETYISQWLDEHPEATTTVQDGTISTPKLASGAVTMPKLGYDVINFIDDIAQFGPNLFDKNTLNRGYYYSSNGNLSDNANSYYSEEYIPVSQGTYYYLCDVVFQLIYCTYDANKNFITRITTREVASGEIEIPSGTAYIRISIYNNLTAGNTLTISENPIEQTIPYGYTLKIPSKYITNDMLEYVSVVDFYHEISKNDSFVTSQQGYYSEYGELVTNQYYVSLCYEVTSDCECYFDIDSVYYSVTVFNGPISRANFVARYRTKENTEDNAPHVNSKLALYEGQYVAISNYFINENTGFYTNDANVLKLADNIRLSNTQLQEVTETAQKEVSDKVRNCIVKYIASPRSTLEIYVPTRVGYYMYEFGHFYSTSDNYDVWRINNLHAVDANLSNRVTLTNGGEWECAIRLYGRPDYSGGIAHGNEIGTNIVFLVDGMPYGDGNVSDIGEVQFNELKVIEISTLYDPNDHTTAIATHSKEYTFTRESLTLLQHIDWLIDDTLSYCYLAMLTPKKTYTDNVFTDVDLLPVTSESTYNQNKTGVKKATQYSNNAGFICSLEILEYPTGLIGGDVFQIRDNNGQNYNKMYFYVCTGGSITNGTRWTSKSVYSFDISKEIE